MSKRRRERDVLVKKSISKYNTYTYFTRLVVSITDIGWELLIAGWWLRHLR